MTHRIERDQEYKSADPRDSIRIRVTADETDDRVNVVDALTGKRPRSILARAFHDNPARRTGYVLVRRADGTPAGGSAQS